MKPFILKALFLTLLLGGCSHRQGVIPDQGSPAATSKTVGQGEIGPVNPGPSNISPSESEPETFTVEIDKKGFTVETPSSSPPPSPSTPPTLQAAAPQKPEGKKSASLCEEFRANKKPSPPKILRVDQESFCSNPGLCDEKIDGYLGAAMRRGVGIGHNNGKGDMEKVRTYQVRALAFADGRKSGRDYDILYFAEYGMHTLRAIKLSPQGEPLSVHTVVGKTTPPWETEENSPFDFKFKTANALALSHDQRTIYVAEYTKTTATQVPLTADGLKAESIPVDLTMADGSALIPDITTWNARSFAFSPDGRFAYVVAFQSTRKDPLDKTRHGLFKLELEMAGGKPTGKISSVTRMEPPEGEKILERPPDHPNQLQITSGGPSISCLDANQDEKVELDECLLYLSTGFVGYNREVGQGSELPDGPGIYKIELDKNGDAKKALITFPFSEEVKGLVDSGYDVRVSADRTALYLGRYRTPLTMIPLDPQTGDPVKTGVEGVVAIAGHPCQEDAGYLEDPENPLNAKIDYPLALAFGRDEKHLYAPAAADDNAIYDIPLDPETKRATGVGTLLPKYQRTQAYFFDNFPNATRGFVVNKEGTECYLGAYYQSTVYHCKIDPQTGKIISLRHAAGEHLKANYQNLPHLSHWLSGPWGLALRQVKDQPTLLYLAERAGRLRFFEVDLGNGNLSAPTTLAFNGNEEFFGPLLPKNTNYSHPRHLKLSPDGKFLYAAVNTPTDKGMFTNIWRLRLSEDGKSVAEEPKRLALQEEGKESAQAMEFRDFGEFWRLYFSTTAKGPQVFTVKLDKNTGDIFESEKPLAILGNANWPKWNVACPGGAPLSFPIGQVLTLALDPKGENLFAWSHHCQNLYRLKLNSEGLVDPQTTAEGLFTPRQDRYGIVLGGPGEVRSAAYPWDMQFHPSGKVLFINDPDGNALLEIR